MKEGNNMIVGVAMMREIRNHGDNTNPLILTTTNMEGRRENLNGNIKGGDFNLNIEDGLDNDEMTGLLVTDRKRMRGGPDKYDMMDTPGGS